MKKLAGILGPLGFILIQFFFESEGLSAEARAILACTFWISTWWIFEVTSIYLTALLPIILFPLSGGLDVKTTTAAFGHEFIFLYMGGFFVAIALEKCQFHKRIALNIISMVGVSISRITLGFMVATAFLSMWISNTATTVMMLPIAIAIVRQLDDNKETPEDENALFGKMMMLAIAYSASIGGIATLFGTPPNLVFAGIVDDLYGINIGFLDWLKIGLPISIFLLVISWIYLTRFAFKIKIQSFPGGRNEINRLKKELGKMSHEEKLVAVVFVMMSILLISRQLIQEFVPMLTDSIIALGCGIILFLLPSSKKDESIMTWSDTLKLPWGVLILFGGGMALAKGFTETGLSDWLGLQFSLLELLPVALLILVLIFSVNMLTEITSNLATTAMLLPVLGPIALTIDVHPYLLMISATLAASCAFMLPVATPPNALVFGSGLLRIKDMIRTGIALNLLSILLLWGFVYYLLGYILDIDVTAFPNSFLLNNSSNMGPG